MSAEKIEVFLEKLIAFEHSKTVYNPYKNDKVVNNLRAYLHLVLNEVNQVKLLVGEAPGYLGCRVTGIPFTSSEQLINTNHPTLSKIKSKLEFSELRSENTANFMWDVLKDKRHIPLLWNSFPFHPHNIDSPNSNRAPNMSEIQIGKEFLLALFDIFQPIKIASIGRKGEKALNIAFPDVEIAYIRHPSYGGKADFIRGMTKLI